MNGWSDYTMKQEQYRDQLREAERQRLIQLVAGDCQEAALGRAIRSLVSGIRRRRPPSSSVPCGDYNHLLEKPA